MNKHIKKDFDMELEGNLPFKEIIVKYGREPNNELYNQFKALPPHPKFTLYIADKVDLKALDTERTANKTSGNKIPLGKHQLDFDTAKKEFFESDDLDPRYYGRSLKGTLIIQTLIKVEDKIKRLETHSSDKGNNTSAFLPIASEASSEIINLLNGFPFRDEVLEDIANRKDGTGYLIEYFNGKEDKDRYLELKGMFDNQIRQAIAKKGVKAKISESPHSAKTIKGILKEEYRSLESQFMDILKIPNELLPDELTQIVNNSNEVMNRKIGAVRTFIEALRSEGVIFSQPSDESLALIFSKEIKNLGTSFFSNPANEKYREHLKREINAIKGQLKNT